MSSQRTFIAQAEPRSLRFLGSLFFAKNRDFQKIFDF